MRYIIYGKNLEVTEGLKQAVHCIGDRAMDMVIEAAAKSPYRKDNKKGKQIVKLILTECDDPGIFRRILVRLIHGRCSCTKGTIPGRSGRLHQIQCEEAE